MPVACPTTAVRPKPPAAKNNSGPGVHQGPLGSWTPGWAAPYRVASGQAGAFDPAADAAAEAEGSTDANKGQRSRYVVSLAKAILETVDRPIGAPLVVGIEHGNQGRNQVKGAMIGRSLVSDRLGKAAFRTSYQRNLTLFQPSGRGDTWHASAPPMSEESLICAPIGRRNPERPFGVKPGLTAVEAGPLAIAPLPLPLHREILTGCGILWSEAIARPGIQA